MTKIYYATTHRADEMNALRATKPETILVSFALWKNKPLKILVDELGYRPKSIILDPGAITFDKAGLNSGIEELHWYWHGSGEKMSYKKIAKILWEECSFEPESLFLFHAYLTYIAQNWEYIDHVLAYDKIGDPYYSSYAYRVMKHMLNPYGIQPIPVFHYQSDLSYLKSYVRDNNELIALGGTLKEPKITNRVKWIKEIVSLYPNQKFHLLGCQRRFILAQVPEIYSCDGNAWKITAGYINNRKPGQTKVEKSIEIIRELQKVASKVQ